MIVLLAGAPGAGKGTQADLLASRDGFRKISTGDALRRQIKLGSPVGMKAKAFMDAGQLVPDETLLGVLKAELGDNPQEKILLDGYPRNIAQAETLAGLTGQTVKAAIHLDVPQSVLIDRLSGRRTCEKCGATYHARTKPTKQAGVCDVCGGSVVQRSDDTEEKVKVRLEVYEQQTRPVLKYYEKAGVYRHIEGDRDTEAVYKDLKAELSKLLG